MVAKRPVATPKRVSDLEVLAIKELSAKKITPADLQAIKYRAIIGATVICRQDVFTTELPDAAALPAMTWAACQAVKSDVLSSEQLLIVGLFLGRMEIALRYPEIQGRVLNEYMPDIQRGKKTLAGAKHAHEKLYGTKAEKAARYEEYQKAVDRCHEEHPSWGYESIKSKVAEEFRCSSKTIQRHTRNPFGKV